MSAAALVPLLRERGTTLATAESLTGGQVAAAITSIPGASAVYLGGVVSYATDVKVSLLGVPQTLVDEEGVVSSACALAMARGVRTLLGAAYAISTTGVAGPDEQEGKPVGRVHVAAVGPDGEQVRELALTGDRARIQARAVEEALALVVEMLPREDGGLR